MSKAIIESETPLLTVKQVAKILNVKCLSVYRMTKNEQLKRADVPGPIRFDMYENNLDKYVQIKEG